MEFIKTNLESSKGMFDKYYNDLNGGFDDFFEEIIIKGFQYKIKHHEEIIGVFAISADNKLICIHLENKYINLYELIFNNIVKFNEVQGIVSITNDTKMLNEIIKRNYRIIKQAYNFIYTDGIQKTDLEYKKATLADISTMKNLFKDFFNDYEERVKTDSLYLGIKNNKIVSLGHIKHHEFNADIVSIGMIVTEDERKNGYGCDTIKAMINEGIKRDATIQAGCWFYNHASKKTLEKAGLNVSNIIIRVDEF
ncbi:MAG: hypothetical protein ABF289_06640 [Clostridiales bacterium]